MKTIIKFKVSKAIDLFVSLPLITYIFWSNTLLSDNFEQMPLRAIDDLAMQSSIHLSLLNFAQGHFSQLVYKFDYGYGWLFWNFYQLWISPFALIFHLFPTQLTEKTLIIMGRQLTLLILVATVYVTRKLLLNLHRENPIFGTSIFGSLSTVIILMNPIVGYWAGRLQPPILATFFFLTSIYFLTLDKLKPRLFTIRFKRVHTIMNLNELISYFLFGCAVGIKPNFALCAVIYIYFIIQIKGSIGLKHTSKKLIATLIGFAIGASPGIILNPNVYLRKYFITVQELSAMSMNYSSTSRTLLNSVILSLEDNLFGKYGFLFVSIIVLVALVNLNSPKKTQFTNLFGIVSFICPIALVGMKFDDRSLVGSYLLPALILFPIFLIHLISGIGSKRIQAILVSCLSIFVLLNFIETLDSVKDRTFYSINSWQIQDKLVKDQGKLKEQTQLKHLIPLDSAISQQIFQDYEVPPPWSSYRKGVQVNYVFDNWDLQRPNVREGLVWLLFDRTKEIRAIDDSSKQLRNLNSQVAKSLKRSQIYQKEIIVTGKFSNLICVDFDTLKYTHVFKCEYSEK